MWTCLGARRRGGEIVSCLDPLACANRYRIAMINIEEAGTPEYGAAQSLHQAASAEFNWMTPPGSNPEEGKPDLASDYLGGRSHSSPRLLLLPLPTSALAVCTA